MGVIEGGATVHTILGITGNITTIIFYFISTFNPVWQTLKPKPATNTTRECSSYGNQFYIFMFFNCALWTFYGMPFNKPHNFWVLLTNAIGSTFAVIAIFIFYHYASKKQKLILKWEMQTFLSLFTILVLGIVLVNTNRHIRIIVVGSICAVFSSCMHLALLSELATAWSSRDVTLLHPVPSIAAFLKGALWTAYGANATDMFIVVPNAIGVLTGVFQAVLCLIIQCSTQSETLEPTPMTMMPNFPASMPRSNGLGP